MIYNLKMVISIIGTGYVGLVTGAVFADFGHTVYCVDTDRLKINLLNKNKIPFFEPGLEELVKRNSLQKRLFFTTNYQDAIPQSSAVFICVGTPPMEDGQANLTFLRQAAKETAKYLKNYTLIVIKSTVPIGVEKELQELIQKISSAQFEFASCPEFLKEGQAIEDSITPDRIVIGTSSKKAEKLLLDIYKPFNGQRLICDLTSAQMIKYASNTLLATKISFANAIANLCEMLNANAEVVLKGVGQDKRIGPYFLKPGVGYGGSCFPKDLQAFLAIAQEANYSFNLLKEVENINNHQIDLFVSKVIHSLGKLRAKTVAVLGLSFKPNTDDIREAPSLKIINKLLELGINVKAYDPIAINSVKKVFNGKITYSLNAYEAAKDSHALLIITEWNEFKELDLLKLKKTMKQPLIIDGRNIYEPSKVKSLGFKYISVGRNN